MADQSQSYDDILSVPSLLTIERGRTDEAAGKVEVLMRGAVVSEDVVELARVWVKADTSRETAQRLLAEAAGVDLDQEVWGHKSFLVVWM